MRLDVAEVLPPSSRGEGGSVDCYLSGIADCRTSPAGRRVLLISYENTCGLSNNIIRYIIEEAAEV